MGISAGIADTLAPARAEPSSVKNTVAENESVRRMYDVSDVPSPRRECLSACFDVPETAPEARSRARDERIAEVEIAPSEPFEMDAGRIFPKIENAAEVRMPSTAPTDADITIGWESAKNGFFSDFLNEITRTAAKSNISPQIKMKTGERRRRGRPKAHFFRLKQKKSNFPLAGEAKV